MAKKYGFLGNEKLDMIIDARLLCAPDKEGYHWAEKWNGGAAHTLDQFSFPASITWGVAYKIGKSGFKRSASIVPAVVPVPFTTQQYEDLAGRVAELEKENADLKNKIANLENENEDLRKKLASGQNYVYEQGQFVAVETPQGAPLTIYFDCGSATVSAREKAHFEYFAENCVKEDTKLNVNGYADKQTGTAKRNQQLSEQRAKAVVELLKKAGAKEENITCAAHGASVQPFEGAAKNRVVTIEIVK
jgi:outer membrane protein OmpA-like peptidoglycan-associated protein